MALIPLPTKFSFTRVSRFGLMRSGNILRSRFTGQAQRIIYPYAMWEFEGKLVEYDGNDAAAIRAFLMKLEGYKNTFELPVPGYVAPSTGFVQITQPNVSSSALVRAVSISGRFYQGSTPIFNAGDYFTVNNELKVVTSSVSTDINGYATVAFQPPLRKAITILTTPIIVNNPYCLMHAADEDIAAWGLSPPIRQGVDIKAIEAIEV